MRINVIYFSCGRDETSLKLSIESLKRHIAPNRIIVVSDNRDPIISPDPTWTLIQKKSSDKLVGLDNIGSMIDVFYQESHDCDYIMKIDSDIVVCNNNAFGVLEGSRPDAYGGHPMAGEEMIPEGHFTGAAYFISKDFVRNLYEYKKTFGWHGGVHHWNFIKYPEDMVISHQLSILGAKTRVDWSAMNRGGYYWFDTYLTDIHSKGAEEITKYSFAHCRSSNSLTKFVFEQIYGKI